MNPEPASDTFLLVSLHCLNTLNELRRLKPGAAGEIRFWKKKIILHCLLFIQSAFYPAEYLIKGFLNLCLRILESFFNVLLSSSVVTRSCVTFITSLTDTNKDCVASENLLSMTFHPCG